MRVSTDPIAQLMQEHDEALLQLKQLHKSLTSISVNGYSTKDFRNVRTALKFIEDEVGIHNGKEEKALFPVLERYVEGPTRIMRSDHKKLHKGFAQLSQAVKRYDKNRDSFSATKRLVQVGKGVVQLFVNHIHKENHILFPLIQKFLDKEELREIARKML